jgi:hypothetical protein
MHKTPRKVAITLAALAVAASTLVSVSTAATASTGDPLAPAARTDAKAPAGYPTKERPPKGFSSWAEVLKVQAKLDRAADSIVAAKGPGFAGITVSPETGTVTAYFTGTPDARSAAAIAAARSSVKVTVARAAHSQAELAAAARTLTATAGVTSIAVRADGSGLDVATAGGASSKMVLRSKVPLHVAPEASRPTLASRGNDFAPYWGGARWGGCSTGFSVNHAGYTRILSAGHCGDNGNSAYDGGGDYMGVVYGDDNFNDTLLINARGGGRIYDGGSGVGEFSKPVIGALHSYVGDWVCQSGAYSGATCNIQVKATGVWIWVGYWIAGNVMAEQVNHTNMMGNGDSGGPVFSLAWWDYGLTYAKGTNTAIDLGTTVACTGVPAGGGRNCAWRGYYQDVVNSLSRYGATITTG